MWKIHQEKIREILANGKELSPDELTLALGLKSHGSLYEIIYGREAIVSNDRKMQDIKKTKIKKHNFRGRPRIKFKLR
jgi:hypothetical protein